jgi:hypothetical protein
MKVKVKLSGVSTPRFYDEVPVDIPGHSFGELSHCLLSEMDSETKKICFGETGELKPDIMTIVNGLYVLSSQRGSLHFKEGDLIGLLAFSG